MAEVAPLLVLLGSHRGGHLEDKHDARIIFSCHATIVFLVSYSTDTPHDAPRDTDLGISRGLARGYAVTVFETIIVSILVLIFVTFLIDCQRHMLVQNTMTQQNLLHLSPELFRFRTSAKKFQFSTA